MHHKSGLSKIFKYVATYKKTFSIRTIKWSSHLSRDHLTTFKPSNVTQCIYTLPALHLGARAFKEPKCNSRLSEESRRYGVRQAVGDGVWRVAVMVVERPHARLQELAVLGVLQQTGLKGVAELVGVLVHKGHVLQDCGGDKGMN